MISHPNSSDNQHSTVQTNTEDSNLLRSHINDLAEIRQLMERSSKFLSLSGWSGIIAGLIALAGLLVAGIYLDGLGVRVDQAIAKFDGEQTMAPGIFLIVDAIVVLVLALAVALYFSWKKAQQRGEKLWSPVLKRLITALAIPLITGTVLCIILIIRGNAQLVAPLLLIFYGMALVNAGKYTNIEVVLLGLAEILTGLSAAIFLEHSLYLWGAGFGAYHIIYGIALYYKYDRKQGAV